MMEDSDILTLGWGCEPASNLWHHAGEEFVTLDVEDTKDTHEFATLEVAKERDRQFYNSCVDTDKIHQVIPFPLFGGFSAYSPRHDIRQSARPRDN